MGVHRPQRNWTEALPLVLVIGLLVIGALAGFAVAQGAEKDQILDVVTDYYEGTRDDVNTLCDDEANAAKPECAETPPPAEKIVETPKPPEAVGPSTAQVRAAVTELLPLFIGPGINEYCGVDRCRGEQGDDGKDGEDGEDGADAPPVTAAQVAAAVAAYCEAHDGCRGPKGDPGEDGDDADPPSDDDDEDDGPPFGDGRG